MDAIFLHLFHKLEYGCVVRGEKDVAEETIVAVALETEFGHDADFLRAVHEFTGADVKYNDADYWE